MTVTTSVLTDLPEQDYAAIRATVRTGDMALCVGTNAFSRVIRWVSGSPWSHIALIVRFEEIDRVMVLEAVAKIGVRMVPLSRFVLEDSDRHRPYPGKIVIVRHADFARRAGKKRVEAMLEFATDRLGAPFRVGEMVKIFLRMAANRVGLKLPRIVRQDDEFICSEYVSQCLARVGIDIPWDGRGFIAPEDFAQNPRIKPVARVAQRPFPDGKPKSVSEPG